MRKIYFLIIFIILVDLLFQQCANPITPKGGPKDTIPPTIIEVFPETGTTNFNGQTITLEFDEYINADKLQQNLVIIPKSELKYKHQIKKMSLILKFEEPFEDSTTYSLNFFDGVTDITERNSAVNLYIAFSTGSFIDSMQVSGDVIDLFSQEKIKGFTVGLYPITDTLNFLTHNPTYFTSSDEDGNYELNFIKSGSYKLLAFNDENRNLLLDPETESHGFLSDTLNLLVKDTLQHSIRTHLFNVKPIKFINSRPVAQYIEAKYSREIDEYKILPDSNYSIIIGEKNDGIRIYKNNQHNFNDSVQFILHTSDSLGNSTIDTIKHKFIDSNRKLPSFSSNISTKSNQLMVSNQSIKIDFNKPIIHIDTANFHFKKDSTFLYPINPSLQWNKTKDQLEIFTYVNIDSLLSQYEKSLPIDSTLNDSTEVTESIGRNILGKSIKRSPTLDFEISSGAFISIENDTSKTQTITFKTEAKESFGSLNVNLTTDNQHFTLQLLSKGKVIHEASNNKNVAFPKVPPGNYSIRILIDDNGDGKWSYGNILKNEEPESIYLFPEETSIRENWVIDIDISF